jgi:DNA repair protein RecN (Recombination protein N)
VPDEGMKGLTIPSPPAARDPLPQGERAYSTKERLFAVLRHLAIHHLAVVESLALRFQPGMTVFTGETGAGKSVLIEALGLVLGDRADSNMIRNGFDQAEVSAIYDIKHLPRVVAWLQEQSLEAEESCVIRRIIYREGPSKATINGRFVSLQQLRSLGEYLTSMHGQHQHQALLKPEHQRFLLDDFAKHTTLTAQVQADYEQYQRLSADYDLCRATQDQRATLELLSYQLAEMDALQLQEHEVENLEQAHKRLSQAEGTMTSTGIILNTLKSDHTEDMLSTLDQAIEQISRLRSANPELASCMELLKTARVHLEEGVAELLDFKARLTIDPARLEQIEHRLNAIHTLARKHRIPSEQILQHQAQLRMEWSTLQTAVDRLATLAQEKDLALKAYTTSAQQLSDSRQKAALVLEASILSILEKLAMPKAQFKIGIETSHGTPTAHGLDQVIFQVTLNPGLPLQPLKKVASGGELSRISLAIQLITATQWTTPTLVFDEADAGISGKTASQVGQLLRQLSDQTQVLCVTHLGQVAAMGTHHYRIVKDQTIDSTLSHVEVLSPAQRIEEIARILGGSRITASGLEHAKELLEAV